MLLSRRSIIAAAIELIEADGIEAVSMRRLATELGCGLISLYNYVPSRNALLDAVADEVMPGIAGRVGPQPSWRDELLMQARAFRQAARAHPQCAMVALSRRPVPASMKRPAERALATLREAGFSGPDAVRIVRALAAYVLGALLREAGAAPGPAAGDSPPDTGRRLQQREFPHLSELYPELQAREPDGDFEFGLDLLMHAVTARVS